MCSLETATRQLNFDEPRIPRKETEYPRVPIWKHKKGRRLDFGVADPSVLLNCPGKQKNVMFPWNVSFGLEISIQRKLSQNAVSASYEVEFYLSSWNLFWNFSLKSVRAFGFA